MIQFIAGTMIGGLLGIVTMCLCQAVGTADEKMGLK